MHQDVEHSCFVKGFTNHPLRRYTTCLSQQQRDLLSYHMLGRHVSQCSGCQSTWKLTCLYRHLHVAFYGAIRNIMLASNSSARGWTSTSEFISACHEALLRRTSSTPITHHPTLPSPAIDIYFQNGIAHSIQLRVVAHSLSRWTQQNGPFRRVCMTCRTQFSSTCFYK